MIKNIAAEIASDVIMLALRDYLNPPPKNALKDDYVMKAWIIDYRSAERFFFRDGSLFSMWCGYVGINPEMVRRKVRWMKKRGVTVRDQKRAARIIKRRYKRRENDKA